MWTCFNNIGKNWETFFLSISHCHCPQHPLVILGMLWPSIVVLCCAFAIFCCSLAIFHCPLPSSNCHPMSSNIFSLCFIILWTKTWCPSNQNFATLKQNIMKDGFFGMLPKRKGTLWTPDHKPTYTYSLIVWRILQNRCKLPLLSSRHRNPSPLMPCDLCTCRFMICFGSCSILGNTLHPMDERHP